MRDLFDDFMDEMRRREAAARGEDPGPVKSRRGGSGPDEGPDDDDDQERDADADAEAGETAASDADDVQNAGDADSGEDARDTTRRPTSVPPRRSGPPRGRGPGGPNDGADSGGGARRVGRQIGLGAAIVAAFALFLLFSVGLDLWTDALWYVSVGFDSVFFTRLSATAGLFLGAFLLAAIVLLANLFLARHLSPPPVEGGQPLRSFIDRLSEAAQASQSPRDRPGQFGRTREGNGAPGQIVFQAGDLPDLTPLAGAALGALAIFLAILIGASVSSAWETVLLWIHRVPFSPATASAVTDPIFGRDVSFFLFELPFLRLVQGLFNGLVVAALIISLGRYLVGASRGGLVFSTPVRIHLAVLGGLFLLSVAFGYQLDKFDLSYSTRGVAAGVSFTDQNAQFFAYDVLTVMSGIAAVLLVGARGSGGTAAGCRW